MSRFKTTTTQGQLVTSRRRFLTGSGMLLAAGGLASGAAGTLLAACGNTQQTTGPVEVSYTFIQFGTLPDAPAVSAAMNATEQFKNAGLKIKLNPMDFASYDQKLQLGYASGAEYDAVFTAPWVNSYIQNSLKGNFLPLDDLLPQHAPELYKSMPEQFWEASKINGKIYGVPNQNYFAYVMGVYIDKPMAEKYGHYIPNVLNSFADMEPFLQQVKANEPNVTPIYLPNGGAYGRLFQGPEVGFDVFQESQSLAAIRYQDPQREVFLVCESPEYQQAVELRWRWGQAGFYRHDPVPLAQATAQFEAGQYAMLIGTQAKPNDVPGTESSFGRPLVVRQVGTPFITTDAIQQNMNAVVRSSQHPDKVVQFLNLVNTDETIFNLLAHGIEGKHYVFVDKAKKLIGFPSGVTAATDKYNPSSDWMFGNEQLGYYTDPSTVGIYANIQHANNTAARSSAFGFTFDPTPVKAQIAEAQSVGSTVDTLFTSGRLDPNDLPKYIGQIKQSGGDAIVAEVQRQMNAWAKTQK